MSKEALLSCDWEAVKPSSGDLAEWPLLQSISTARANGSAVWPAPAFHDAGGAAAVPAPVTAANTITPDVPRPDSGVEENKECQQGLLDTRKYHLNDAGKGHEALRSQVDEWAVVRPDAPAGGVLLRDAPNDLPTTGSWRLAPGQIVRLSPTQASTGWNMKKFSKGWIEAEAETAGWRRVACHNGNFSWLAPRSVESDGSDNDRSPPALERYQAHWFIQDAFSIGARCGGSVTWNGIRRLATSSQTMAMSEFWVPLRPIRRAITAGFDTSEPAPAIYYAVQLQGDSDALFLSAPDVAGQMSQGERADDSGKGVGRNDGKECNSLIIVGNWKIGLVTDTLTITTRTSGFTRIVPSPPANTNADGRDKSAAAVASTSSRAPHTSDSGAAAAVAKLDEPSSLDEPLPLLVDGLVFGFRAADGLLTVGRTIPTASSGETKDWRNQTNLIEPRAAAYLGCVDEDTEVTFTVIDAGEDIMFSCRETDGRRRAATVRARCRDSWGRGRVAFGARRAPHNASTGWLRVVSQAHGAMVRSGTSIDADGVVGRIPCGTVVPYDRAIIYTSPGVQDRDGIDPVVRYRCIATATTPAGWISERGRYANHPYRICEQKKWQPHQSAHVLSQVSIGDIGVPTSHGAGSLMDTNRTSHVAGLPLPRPTQRKHCEGGLDEWQQRLDELSTLSARFHLVQRLNRSVSQALPFVDFSQGELPWSLAALISRCRHLIFSSLKLELWRAELVKTERPLSIQDNSSGPPIPLELRLNRGRAARNTRLGNRRNIVRNRERRTLFGQAFHALSDAPMEVFRLRPGDALYTTVFVGEHAHDAGGEVACGSSRPLDVISLPTNIRICR